ncbi:alpha/beta fold hydrolase [Streptomyces capitiformicae]|nr:alpha/beta fold hydrolase [Streptomyces capitiformicae]
MYDARGHGESTRRPADMSREAAVRDAVTVIHELGLKEETTPLTFVGQSLGGHTAFLAAVAHPESLDSLILMEPGPGAPNPGLPAEIAAWLDRWDPGDRAAMFAAIAELAEAPYHSQWAATTCPTLVVRGANGTMPAADADTEAMPTARGPRPARRRHPPRRHRRRGPRRTSGPTRPTCRHNGRIPQLPLWEGQLNNTRM